ncbi:hypothetical protein ACIRBX_04220 [Kitasatospora sp. NPDC096147]|uniref:hypothetical protein n=1 Tax=Kitasatospora sp. NPDC096147 TaxID=3364093 RepID=UPI0038040CAE
MTASRPSALTAVLAVVRYTLADFLRSQRGLPQLALYLGLLAVLHAFPGPVLQGYGASAGALLPVTVWLALTLHHTEDPLQATVTAVNAGGAARALIGRTAAALLCGLALAVVALVWPMAANGTAYGPGELTDGLLAHTTAVLTGTALGGLCARPVIRRPGHAFAAAALLSLVALVSRTVSPVNGTVRLLSAAPPAPATTTLLAHTAWAAALLAVCTALTARLARRLR